MAGQTAILVDGVWEEFKITSDRARSFKEVISRFRFVRGRTSVWALSDVSLAVETGETVALIGENGSGKSTLLRCIAGILPPTRGEVLVSGPVSSLIELGAGFHPELTGRENALVTAALFGLSRRQLMERFDSIVEFAELQGVIDQPVRSYSTGMYVRLGFALAVHVDPEILLIDEVLAVGDEAFQRKCIARIEEMQRAGVTILFVSHNLRLIERLCGRAIWMRSGRAEFDGPSSEVVKAYLAHVDAGG